MTVAPGLFIPDLYFGCIDGVNYVCSMPLGDTSMMSDTTTYPI